MSTKVAIIGPGNIGTDLLIKIKRLAADELETVALVGIDPESDGLARARRLGIAAIATGVEGLVGVIMRPMTGSLRSSGDPKEPVS